MVRVFVTNSVPGPLGLCSNCRHSCYSRLVVVMVVDGGVAVVEATFGGLWAEVDAAGVNYDRAAVVRYTIDGVHY